MSSTEIDWTTEEREAFRDMAGRLAAPSGEEKRVLAAVRRSGVVRGRSAPNRVVWSVLAAVVLAVGGLVVVRSGSVPTGSGATFLLLLREGHDYEAAPAADRAARVAEYSRWARSLRRTGNLVAGDELGAESIALGSVGQPEREAVAGYFILRARDLTEAARLAAGCPHLAHRGSIEVRPIV